MSWLHVSDLANKSVLGEIRIKIQHDDEEAIRAHDDPGHRYVTKAREKQFGGTGTTSNGYSKFIKYIVKKEYERTVRPDDYRNPRYNAMWEGMTAEDRIPYKSVAQNGMENELDAVDALAASKEKLAELEQIRHKCGMESLCGPAQVPLFFPPSPSELPFVRGRQDLRDLEAVQALYILLEGEQREKDEKTMDLIIQRYSLQNFRTQRIFVFGCIPLAEDPNPVACVRNPLEIYLASFSLEAGIHELAYHSYVLAGDSLDWTAYSQGRKGPLEEHQFRRATKKASKAAWCQAHFRHNLPYQGFQPMDERYTFDHIELHRFSDGWDIAVKESLHQNRGYYELYITLTDLLNESIEEGGSAFPPLIFALLNECEMVEECLQWLREKAVEQAMDNKISTEVLPDVPKVCSVEHLMWHIFGLLGIQCDEGMIEQGVNDEELKETYGLQRCAYHAMRLPEIECARSKALLVMYNVLQLLEKAAEIKLTAKHRPADFEDSEEEDAESQVSAYEAVNPLEI